MTFAVTVAKLINNIVSEQQTTVAEGGTNRRIHINHSMQKMCKSSAQTIPSSLKCIGSFSIHAEEKGKAFSVGSFKPMFWFPPSPPLFLSFYMHKAARRTLKTCLRCLNSSLPAQAWGSAQPDSLVDRL